MVRVHDRTRDVGVVVVVRSRSIGGHGVARNVLTRGCIHIVSSCTPFLLASCSRVWQRSAGKDQCQHSKAPRVQCELVYRELPRATLLPVDIFASAAILRIFQVTRQRLIAELSSPKIATEGSQVQQVRACYGIGKVSICQGRNLWIFLTHRDLSDLLSTSAAIFWSFASRAAAA